MFSVNSPTKADIYVKDGSAKLLAHVLHWLALYIQYDSIHFHSIHFINGIQYDDT